MEDYRSTLLALRKSLQAEELADDQVDVVTLDQSRVGRLSRMDALQTQQIALDAKRRRLRRLQAIEGALRRLEAGEFGDCFVCGEEIGVQRLRFDPTITRCKTCVSALD